MTDDTFKLGNFSGMPGDDKNDGGLEDLDELTVTPSFSPPHEGEKEHGIIKHPTVEADPQPQFRSYQGKKLLEIDLEMIVPNEFQPRRIFDPEKLQELAESIKQNGIIQPLVVVERKDGKFEIIVGERRFRASRLAGLTRVPAFVNPAISNETKLEIALIENIQRADLNPIEEAKAYQRLVEEFKLPLMQVAKRVGKNHSTISNLIRLLNLPVEVQRALIEGTIAEGQARPLLTLRDHEEMLEMFHIVMKEQMKVRDIEAKVREIKKRQIKVAEMFTPDPFLTSLENLLRNKFGTRVAVNKGAKGGKITIEFYSDEELNDIVNKIA